MFRTRSPGYATNPLLAALDGDVMRGQGYLAACTACSLTFWWGNFVSFGAPPETE